MSAISVSEIAIADLKQVLRKAFPEVKSSHLTEAIAASMGFRTHAALIAAANETKDDPAIVSIRPDSFQNRLAELGYPNRLAELDLELLAKQSSHVIETMPPSGHEVKYISARSKAWRNLMVLAINAGLQQKLFSLRPSDNRWPGAAPDKDSPRGNGHLFDFSLPNGLPARGYVSDAGFGELAIHVVVNPKGDWVKSFNSGFLAGDAFAGGWLEREVGAWMQTTNRLVCRKRLVNELAGLDAVPMGFGDRGRVIL